MNADRPDLIFRVGPEHAPYLRDESRYQGQATQIAFPVTEEQVTEVLRRWSDMGAPVTVQGALTGITGGAVPRGGAVLNLSRMRRVMGVEEDTAGRLFIRVQPGITLHELQEGLRAGYPQLAATRGAGKRLREGRWFFPPNPTETGASVGGMVACNASGSLTFRYGPVRPYVQRLRLALVDGDHLELERGRQRARGRRFHLITDAGRVLEGTLPGYRWPEVKNAAGYFAADNMDLVDLFIGSEGTLGVITEVSLEVVPEPAVRWGVTVFLREDTHAVPLVEALRSLRAQGLAAMEYIGPGSLELLRQGRRRLSVLEELPALEKNWQSALYLEIHGPGEDAAMELLERVWENLEAAGVAEEDTWMAMDRSHMERFKNFRHAVPELVNLRVDELRRASPRITKLGTDMAVPDGRLADMFSLYRSGVTAEKLEAVTFGHIGDNHIHLNVMAYNHEEYQRAWRLYKAWAEQVVEWGGTVSAEHGVGKLKPELLVLMYGEQGVGQMLELKRVFDPQLRLAPGTLFGQRTHTHRQA